MADCSILFADLAGFTALTEAHGDTAATDLLDRFYDASSRALTEGARVVKTIGDAVMVCAPTATSCIKTAVALRRAIDATPSWPALRAGMHCGPVVERAGDCFGATVNVAARVAAQARGGQLLCTRAMVDAVPAGGFPFRPMGEALLKNVYDAVELFELGDEASTAATALDPVCRMRVDPATAPAHLAFEGKTYWFCSFKCVQAFVADPLAILRPP